MKKMNKRTTNSLAIEDFQKDNNIAFGILYKKYFGYTRKFVLENKGNLEDAEDVFQDALIILYEKLYDDHFKAYTCLANYVTGISKNLWLKKLRNRNFSVEVYESYYFENNYSPRNSCATGNNEFSAMTSLYSIYNNCTSNLYVNNTYPESIFNLFNNRVSKDVYKELKLMSLDDFR